MVGCTHPTSDDGQVVDVRRGRSGSRTGFGYPGLWFTPPATAAEGRAYGSSRIVRGESGNTVNPPADLLPSTEFTYCWSCSGKAGSERRPGTHQRNTGVDRSRLGGIVRRGRRAGGRRCRRLHVGRCAQGKRCAVRRSHSSVRGQPGQIAVARIPAADRGQRDSRLPPRLLACAGSVLVPLPAAGHGRLSRSDSQLRRDALRRGQRRYRQPPVVHRARRRHLRGQLPRRAGRFCRRRAGARPLRDGQPVGAAHGGAGRSENERPAGISGREQRAQFRVHDCAGDRRGSRFREQDYGLSLQRGLHTHFREPGRSCQHGHSRSAPARADGRQRRRRGGHRIARRRAGNRLS